MTALPEASMRLALGLLLSLAWVANLLDASAAVMLCLGLCLVAMYGLGRAARSGAVWVWGVLFAVTILARGLFITLFDARQVSDFGVYYRCGSLIGKLPSIAAWVDSCRSHFLPDPGLYWRRSALYTAPIFKIFGVGNVALKIGNLCIHIGTLGVYYVVIRSIANRPLALLATALFGFYPELWYSITLASPDNVAPLSITLLLGVLHALFSSVEKSRPIPAAALAALAGLLLIALGMQRDLDLPLLLNFLVLSLVFLWERRKQPGQRLRVATVSICVILTIFTYAAGARWIGKLMGGNRASQISWTQRISGIDLSQSTSWGEVYPWGRYYYPAIPSELRNKIANRKILTELTAVPSNLFGYLYRKSKIVFLGTGALDFSTTPAGAMNPDDQPTDYRRLNHQYLEQQVPLAKGFVLLVLGLSVLGLSLGWTQVTGSPGRPAARRPLAIFLWSLGVLYVPLLLIGEVQARYSALLIPVLAPLAAAGLLALTEPRRWRDGAAELRSLGAPAVGFAALCCLYGVVCVLCQRSALVQVPMAGEHAGAACAAQEARNAVSIELGAACLRTASEQLVFRKVLPARPGATTLSLFVSSENYPIMSQVESDSPAIYTVRIGQQTLLRDALGSRPVVYYALPLLGPTQGQALTISVEKPAGTTSTGKLAFKYLDIF